MNDNICHFIPYHKDYHSIHTINFVLETNIQKYNFLKSESVYKMYYVASGNGFIHTAGKVTPLNTGDIFFSFPSHPFAIESGKNFSYMYISFVGIRGNMIMENLKISENQFVFRDFNEVGDFWRKGISTPSEFTDLISESILLYTFSLIGNRGLSLRKNAGKHSSAVQLIKKYVDDNFSDVNFSLDNIHNELFYNKKYISAIFKKEIGVNLIEYLTTVRIQYACTMMQQDFSSVRDIAFRCGYSDSQYFSKVFKKKMGMSPLQYMKENKGVRT